MKKKICEISASSWFYYKEICYDARSDESKILQNHYQSIHSQSSHVQIKSCGYTSSKLLQAALLFALISAAEIGDDG